VKIFRERHPQVLLSLVEKEPEEAALGLRARELDVAVVFDYPDLPASETFDALYEGLELIQLLDDPMYLALPPDHPLAGAAKLRLEDLAEESWIRNDDTGPCGRLHVAACRAAGFEPEGEFRSDDFNVVQGLVAAGAGVSLIPELALTYPREDIVVRSLGKRAPRRRIFAAVVSRGHRSAATTAMLDVMREAGEGYRKREKRATKSRAF
jgi:DNA-binding transcriptional LysR family regulator